MSFLVLVIILIVVFHMGINDLLGQFNELIDKIRDFYKKH